MGHLASRGWSCRDAGQHGANPGHPGKSGTGGNPTPAGPGRFIGLFGRVLSGRAGPGFRPDQSLTTLLLKTNFLINSLCSCPLPLFKPFNRQVLTCSKKLYFSVFKS